jgi:hypothetical protein
MAALLLVVLSGLPGFLIVPLPVNSKPEPVPRTQTAPEPALETRASPPSRDDPQAVGVDSSPDWGVWLAWPFFEPPRSLSGEERPSVPVKVGTAGEPTLLAPAPPTFRLSDLWPAMLGGLAVGYGVAAAGLLLRWLCGQFGLWRLLRSAKAAPIAVVQLFEEMTPDGWRPRLLVSDRLRTPISCGLWRPTVVLPRVLCFQPGPLRWVFAHELAHLRRRDVWTCWLFGLGAAVFFYLPWFWWLRSQVRLCQEYLADAAVLDQDSASADYAQFLLSLNTPPLPAGATGVSGRPSELFRRVKMLLGSPVRLEQRCPGVWSCVVATVLVGLAVFGGGVRLEAEAVLPPESRPAPEANVPAPAAPQESSVPSEPKSPAAPMAPPPAPHLGKVVPWREETLIVWNGSVFQVQHTNGSLVILLTGVAVKGQMRIISGVVIDGAVAVAFDSTARVPEASQTRVNNLLDLANRDVVRPKPPPLGKVP